MLKLRSKIQIASVLVIAIIVLLMTAPVILWAYRDANDRLARSLLTRADVFDQLWATRDRGMMNTVRLVASNPDFRRIALNGDAGQLQAELRRRARGARADIAVLMDASGRVIGQTDSLDPPRLAFPGLLSSAADDARPVSILRHGGRIYEMRTVPVPETQPPLWLTIGYELGADATRSIHRLTGLDATLIDLSQEPPAVIASTLPAGEAEAVVHSVLAAQRLADGSRMAAAGEHRYRVIQRRLIDDAPDLVLLLQESVSAARAGYAGLRLHIAAVVLFAMVAALLLGGLLARHIGQPIGELLRAARRIREGVYTEGLQIKRSDELGELAAAFNAMQEGIAEREERITYQAQFDQLTGLPNRLLALQKLADAIALADADGMPVSVLLIDLNRLSAITASLGHDIGDALLSQAAERMRASLDARHVLARLEGDEFLVVMAGVDASQAAETAAELLRLLGAGLSVQDVNVSLDAFIGISCFPEHGRQPDKLLLRAAVAKNDAKAAEEPVRVYCDGREERHVRQLAILGDLRRAARHDEFKLFLQPKIRLADNRVCGAEALLRWDHPNLGFLMPNEFISIAEESGNISLVTDWALAASIRECRLWQEEQLDLDISVNLSGRDLLNPDLPLMISALLRDHDLSARYLVLEITEQALVHDLAHARRVLGCLRDLGARISIDDFGTGYSSLVQVKNLPVDEVKIDRSFVMELPGNRADVAIVRSAIDLAHSLGMEVLAEGVENRATLRWLAAHACERAQGFYIARPMPAEQFGGWVRDYNLALDRALESGHGQVDLSFAANAAAERIRTVG
ncbi:MAG: EAL domain-containing protein [Gammaproteobacteria bacterium]|nr:MAG: EAL domain-containing protein [Gammaproteobacteria bacterium]